MYEILHYLDEAGRDHYQAWLDGLKDRVAKVSIIRRVDRLERGLMGDYKVLRDGVMELRIDVGAGYRVYLAQVGSRILLLTSGGDKRSQDADIERAIELLEDWRKRNG